MSKGTGCMFCDRQIPDDEILYLINPEGGYSMDEVWACMSCMKTAEPGSLIAAVRGRLYTEDVRMANDQSPRA